MVYRETRVNICDNSGAKKALIIGSNFSTGKRTLRIGDVVVVSLKEVEPNGNLKKGSKAYGVIVRVKKEFQRKDGSFVSFSDNAIVLLGAKGSNEPMGTRVFGPIPREIRELGFQKIVSLAGEIV
jgi:large subunit ribosomal protein L14